MHRTFDARRRPPLARVSYTLFLALTAYGLALFGLGPALTSIADTFGVALGTTGALFTAVFVGFIAGVLASGYAAEQLGKRRVTAAGLAILTIGLWLLGGSPGPFVQPHFWWALGSMLVVGFGAGITEATASALVADANPGREGFALNLMQAFFGFGAIAGPLVVGLVLTRGWGWQAHFRIASALTGILFIALVAQKARESRPEPLSLREIGGLLRQPALLMLCGAMALYVGSEIGYTGWISALMEREMGASAALAGLGVTAFWAMMTVGRLGCTWLVESVTPGRLMLWLATGGAVAGAATGLVPAPAWGVAAAGAVGLFYSGVFALILTSASERFSRRRAMVFSLVWTSVGIGGMTLPAVMGLVAQAANLRWTMSLPAAAMGVLALLFALVEGAARPRASRDGSESGAV